jgi:hypothetical protein
MPEAIFPPGFNKALVAALNESVPKLAERFLKRRAREIRVSQGRLRAAASRFLARYRDLLLQNYMIQNMQEAWEDILWMPYAQGPGSDVADVPLAGMLGLPRKTQRSVNRAIGEIKPASPFVTLIFTETRKGIRGELRFDFSAFSETPRAMFSWRGPVSWIRLLEYGVSVGRHQFLGFLAGSPYSRSGGGIMGRSRRSTFVFPPTYVFRDTFDEARTALTPEEAKLLRVRFVR